MEAVSVYGVILVLAVGIVAFLIGRLTSKGRDENKRLEMELEQNREELKNYRSQVSSHFQETAHRVNALTENYRKVYEHLARGAQDLCDKNDAPQLMDELNSSPILGGGETIESPEVEHAAASVETEATSNADQIVDESADDKTEVTDDDKQLETAEAETTQNDDSTESSDSKEISDENIDSDEKSDDEPIAAVEERTEQEQEVEQKAAS